MTIYPAQIDTIGSLPIVYNNKTSIDAESINRLRTAILSIENELGVKPSGIYTTVRGRFDILEGAIGSLQIIKLASDLGNNVNNPYVIGIWGRPISSASPNSADVLTWNGAAWEPHPIPSTISVLDSVIIANNIDVSVLITYVNVLVSVKGLTANHTITLPASPATGQKITVKDADGSLSSHDIIINGNGKNIDSASTYTLNNINKPYSSITIQFDGTTWCIV